MRHAPIGPAGSHTSRAEDAVEFLASMPARPKLLAVPRWHGGSEIPTREKYGNDFERALENFSRYKAVQEHNASLTRGHDAAIDAHIKNWARKPSHRATDPHDDGDVDARIAEKQARLSKVKERLHRIHLQELEAWSVIPPKAGDMSVEDYALARRRRDLAGRLLKLERE